jgi:hypothetical protein
VIEVFVNLPHPLQKLYGGRGATDASRSPGQNRNGRLLKSGRTNSVLCFRMRNAVTLPCEENDIKCFGIAGPLFGVFYEAV